MRMKRRIWKMANEKRLIDANAIEKDMNDRFLALVAEYGYYDHYTNGYGDALCVVEYAPTVDAVEVVHGKWALVEYQSSPFGVDREYQCSICGTPVDDENYRTRYCPNCGAKMDGGNEDV
jgi:rubrerythrin